VSVTTPAPPPVQAPSELRRMAGPSALAGGRRRFLYLTWTIAVQEVKLRFFGSALGYLWQLVNPLLLFGVLYVVFTQAIKLGAEADFFPAVLLLNIIMYRFFADATAGAVTSVIDRENLVRKVQFPRLVVPAAVVLTAAFNFLLNLLAVVFFLALTGVRPRVSWLLAPLLLVLLAALAFGLSMLLSALYVRFRDVRPIWEVALQIAFYASPIIYVIETVDVEWGRRLMLLSPLAALVHQMRSTVIDPNTPSTATILGGAWVLVPLGLIVLVCVVGFVVFNRAAPRIAEDL